MTAGAVDPQFAQLLQEQGVSGDALSAEVADMAAGQQAQQGQFGNLVNILSGLSQAGLSSRQAEAAMGDTFARQALANTAAGFQGQFASEEAKRKQDLMDRISESGMNMAGLQGKIGEARSGVQQDLLKFLTEGASIDPKRLKKAFASQPSAPKGKGKGKQGGKQNKKNDKPKGGK
jgi:hypothetical protein